LVSALVFSGNQLYSGSYDGTVREWDMTSRNSRIVMKRPEGKQPGGPMAALARDYLAWVNVYPADESEVHFLSLRAVQRANPEQILSGHRHAVLALAFTLDGRLASASMDQTVKLWDLHAKKSLHTYTGHEGWVSSVAFSPDGKLLASGSWDETVKI